MSSPVVTATSTINLTLQQEDSVNPVGVTVAKTILNIARQFVSGSPIKAYEYSGVYTPNNDYILVHTWATNPVGAVVLVLTDAPVGIMVSGTVITPVNYCTIDKVAMFRLSQFAQGVEGSLYLDGRPSSNTGTVTQNVPIKWYAVVIDDSALT